MYDINFDVTNKSNLSSDELNNLLSGTGFSGLGSSFNSIETNYNVNSLFAISHGAIESAWGTSYLAKNRNNLFGIAAYDSDPNNAYSYTSKEACIEYYGSFLRNNYLNPTGAFYHGTTIHDIFIDYSSSHDLEANSIVAIMNDLLSKLPNQTMDSYKIYNEGALWWSGNDLAQYETQWNNLKTYVQNGVINISGTKNGQQTDYYTGYNPVAKHKIFIEGALWWWGDDDNDYQAKLNLINSINNNHTISVTTN